MTDELRKRAEALAGEHYISGSGRFGCSLLLAAGPCDCSHAQRVEGILALYEEIVALVKEREAHAGRCGRVPKGAQSMKATDCTHVSQHFEAFLVACANCIDAEVRQARREALEEAAKAVCHWCNDPNDPPYWARQVDGFHVNPQGDRAQPCLGSGIRALAGKEPNRG